MPPWPRESHFRPHERSSGARTTSGSSVLLGSEHVNLIPAVRPFLFLVTLQASFMLRADRLASNFQT